MINKIKDIKNEKNIINNSEINEIHEINEDQGLIDILKNEIKISEKKINTIILTQNEETLKIKNRLNSEINKYKKFSLEKLITEFLPIIDHIECALNLIQQKKEKTYDKILKNLENILSLIKSMFDEFKVSKINDIKVIFNPDIHEAISIKHTHEIQSNYIIEVMQSGYILSHSRLLRPAMVIVSKNIDNNV